MLTSPRMPRSAAKKRKPRVPIFAQVPAPAPAAEEEEKPSWVKIAKMRWLPAHLAPVKQPESLADVLFSSGSAEPMRPSEAAIMSSDPAAASSSSPLVFEIISGPAAAALPAAASTSSAADPSLAPPHRAAPELAPPLSDYSSQK